MTEQIAVEITNLIEQMRKLGRDSQNCEVKSALNGTPKNLAETFSAFSNKDGGTIILGLCEERGFKPESGFRAEAIYSDMLQFGDKLCPTVRPDVHIVPFEGTKLVVVLIHPIPLSERPCYVRTQGTYGGSYIRTGDGDRRLTEYEISRMLEGRVQPRHDVRVIEEGSLADLDEKLVSSFVRRQKELAPRGFETLSTEEILVKMRAIAPTDQGMKPTLAGLLALGRYPQQYFPRLCITCTLYPGTDKEDKTVGTDAVQYRYLDTKRIVGSIPDMVSDTLDFVRKNMRVAARVEGAKRYEEPDYPLIAVREAIANALQHRDYSVQGAASQVQVNMYADRLEILNPGGLYSVATVDSILSSGLSASRNEFLSQILESTVLPDGTFVVENRGTGMKVIQHAMQEAKKPKPRFDINVAFFKIIFDKVSRAEVKTPSKWKDVPTELIAALSDSSSLSIRDIEAMSRLSAATIRKSVRLLLEQHKIEPIEKRNSPKQRYRLIR